MTRYTSTENGLIPYSEEEENRADQQAADAKKISSQITLQLLWQAAHDYEYAQISGSAIGLITMGVMQAKPKCLAVRAWIDAIWAEYYSRKTSGSDNLDFSPIGPCPHTVRELSEELSA